MIEDEKPQRESLYISGAKTLIYYEKNLKLNSKEKGEDQCFFMIFV